MTWTHAVVGCTECTALWVIPADPETVTCPRCRTRHPHSKLRKLATTSSKTKARELRGRLLAEQHGADPDAIDSTSYFNVESELEPTNPPSNTTPTDSSNPTTLSKPELLEHTIHSLDNPTKPHIIDTMAAHGIDEATTITLLEKLRQDGTLLKNNDQYRLT